MNYKDLKKLMADKSAWDKICNEINFLQDPPARQRLWHYDRNQYVIPTCPMCGNNVYVWLSKNKA